MQTSTLHALLVVCIGGLLSGFQQGYPSLAVEVTRSLSDCSRYNDTKTCDAFSAVCWWNATASSCGYRDQATPCSAATTREGCAALPHCAMRNRRCVHAEAWSAAQRSSFTATGVLGTLLSGLCTGAVLGVVTHPTMLGVAALTSAVAAVLLMVSWETPDTERHQLSIYAGLLTGRVMLGLSDGMLTAAPLYGGCVAPVTVRDLVIMTFEVCVPLAGFVFVVMLYFIDAFSSPPVEYEAFHALHGLLLLVSLLLMVLVIAPIDPSLRSEELSTSAATPLIAKQDAQPQPEADAAEHVEDSPLHTFWKPIAAGCVLIIFVQCSGAHVIINFAPTLSAGMGLSPLAGAVLLLGWNMAASVASLFVRRGGIRPPMMLQLGLIGSAIFSTLSAAAFWYEGSNAVDGAPVLMTISLLGKLAAYRLFLIPAFAVFVQQLFTRPWRALGSSILRAFNTCCIIAVLWTYPIVTELLSNESTDEGAAYAFAGFAVVTAIGAPTSYRVFKVCELQP